MPRIEQDNSLSGEPLETTQTQSAEQQETYPDVALGDLTERMQAAVANAGWTELMPVQSKSILYVMAGRDVMVQSRTGSGKTGAFILPLLERLNLRQDVTQALVLTPTRELALQVQREASVLGKEAGMRSTVLYGGVGYKAQLKALKSGVHLVVGTPGRVLDHLMRGSLSLDGLKALVLDEADRMLSIGFYPDMKEVQMYLPKRRVTTCFFSATYPPRVRRLADEFLTDPVVLSLSSDHVHVTDTDHVYYLVPGMEKDRVLVRLIEVENPTSALIFCNTKARVEYVATVLRRFGYDADYLTGDLSQGQRERVLGRILSGDLRFLVATDVAARGIDIPELSHVFQYELPEDHEIYIHRAGRTGRAGASGVAMSIIDAVEKIQLNRIGRAYEIDFEERPVPTDEDVQEIVAERAISLLEAKLRKRDRIETERRQRYVALARELAQDEDGSQTLAMLLDDFYEAAVHPKTAHTPAPTKSKSDRRSGKSRGRRRGGRSRRRN